MKQHFTILIITAMVAVISGCNKNLYNNKAMYNIKYDNEYLYSSADDKPAPKRVRAGELVSIHFGPLATDTKYKLFLDSTEIKPDHADSKLIINMMMPEHDVTITHEKQNTMALHSIDFCGQDYAYLNEPYDRNKEPKSVRKEYYPGEPVVLYYPMIATDTDYSFILDGAQIRPDYETSKGFIIRFTMPDHDVKLQCIERNTMLPDGDIKIIR